MGIAKTRDGYIVPVAYNGGVWRVDVTNDELLNLFRCENEEAFFQALEEFSKELTTRAAAACQKTFMNYLMRKQKESEVKNELLEISDRD